MSMCAIFFFLCLLNLSSSARILTLTPYYGASHFYVFQPLLEGLANRGHSVDVVSYFPRSSPLPNYRDIPINTSASTVGFQTFDGLLSANAVTNLIGLWKLAQEYDEVHRIPEVIALANGTYDLVLIEMFNTNLFYGIAYKTGAPMIGLSSCTMLPWTSDSMAVPSQTSYVPNNLGGRSYRMNFFERVLNTIEFWVSRVLHKLLIDRNAQAVAEHYLGPLPPLSEIASNTSLLLLHTHFSFLGHSPLPASVVEVGGLNLKPLKPLTPDVEKLLNDSNGAIYFSMGSVLVGKSLPENKKQMFVNVLAATGKTVLWKQEETVKNKPSNIITKPWFPQRDILQHPKVELFISHCGNLGLTEGVDAGVPVICIPMYGDQHRNAKAAEDKGISIFLDYGSLTEDKLRSAVNEILTNKKYKETSKKVQAAFRDRPQSPLDTAIYWVEYVLKHGPITRPQYSHMPLWLKEGIDVAAFLFFFVALSAYIVITIFTSYFNSKKSIKKEKQS
ncbi:UDP-glucosyltransferase 2 isoform X4 [Halyomorpha halys]|uniref:UDP-glucosyltransferase 2 isoform X4 n=1 Tax=Halyomorpha halys TaxID=286706 RepID=UPI0006D51EC8|nr:UDP-glucuronosyltransferase 1-7C isoform X1 [Halyomorpha halys]